MFNVSDLRSSSCLLARPRNTIGAAADDALPVETRLDVIAVSPNRHVIVRLPGHRGKLVTVQWSAMTDANFAFWPPR